MVKPSIKRFADAIGSVFAPYKWRPRKGLLVLMYHRILPKESPALEVSEPGMVIHPETLEMHLKYLKHHFNLVDLSEALALLRRGAKLPDNTCAITFDDGWRDNFEYAYPLLVKESVPATIFVVSDLVGTNYEFWPDRMARVIRAASIMGARLPWIETIREESGNIGEEYSREVISELIDCAKGLSDLEIDSKLVEAESTLELSIPKGRTLVSWDEIRQMTKSGIVKIGSHTASHIRLNNRLAPDVMERELCGSKTRIEKETGLPCDVFCYPNGDFNDDAVNVVRNLYLGACTTESGWNDSNQDLYRLKRIGIHEERTASMQGFATRLTGWY